MSLSPTEKEIEDELAAIRKTEYQRKQTEVQVAEFKQRLTEMKTILAAIRAKADPEKSKDMQEVCLFTIFQCVQHIVH